MTRAEARDARTAAHALGLQRYFTGKPCKHGHIAERYVSDRKCVVCSAERERPDRRAYLAEYRQTPECRAYMAKYRQTPEYHAKRAEYERQRCQNDPNYQLEKNLRRRVRHTLKQGWKSARTMDLLGCTIEVLRDHLEAQFQPGMSWENMGQIWHLDHAKPCSSFDLTDLGQQKICFNFSNLQPLFAAENLRKYDKPETEAQFVRRIERLFAA